MPRLTRLLAFVFAGLLVAPGGASAAVVTNGDFETGSLSGWQVDYVNPGMGSWFVYTGSGFSVPPPPQGTHAALTGQTNDSRQILYQDITLPPGGSQAALSLFAYYHSVVAIFSPETLDPAVAPNQQYRIDVMRPTAPIDSVAPGDVLLTVFRTFTGDSTDLAPTQRTVDLSAFAGQTVRLRFAVTVTQNVLNAGADAVSVNGLTVGSAKLNKKKGTAQLPVTVTDPGSVALAGNGVKPRSAPASKSVTTVGAGTVNLVVKAKGKKRRKLNDTGKAKVNVTITYTPNGGAPLSDTTKVKLKKTT
jgi:hypothetical protein